MSDLRGDRVHPRVARPQGLSRGPGRRRARAGACAGQAGADGGRRPGAARARHQPAAGRRRRGASARRARGGGAVAAAASRPWPPTLRGPALPEGAGTQHHAGRWPHRVRAPGAARSEDHTSELQSLMRISYAVFCLKKKKKQNTLNEMNTTKKKLNTSLNKKYTIHIIKKE